MPGFHTRENAVLTGVDQFDVRRVRQHSDDDFAARGDFLEFAAACAPSLLNSSTAARLRL